MSKCKKIQKFLPAFMEGEVKEDLKREIEGHLKGCPMCQKEKELLARTWASLEGWPAIEPSPDFKQKFWKKVEDLETHRKNIPWPGIFTPTPMPRWWGFTRRLAPVLASIFILVFSGSIFIKARIERINLAREIDIYQDLEVIENMDLLVELEAIDEEV